MALATSNKLVSKSPLGPTLPSNPFRLATNTQPISLGSSPTSSMQTSSPSGSGGGSYAKPTGLAGYIGNVGKNIASVVQNPSQGGGLFGAIADATFPTANAQTPVKPAVTQPVNSGTNTGSVTQPTAPVGQASYSGGSMMPAPGTPEYAKALAAAHPVTSPVKTETQSSTDPTGTPGLWQQVLAEMKRIGTAATPATPAIQTLQGQATGANPAATSISGLQDIAQNQTPAVTSAQADLANFRQASPFMLSDVRNNPNVAADVSVGRGAALGQTLSAEEAAKSNTLSAALAGQGQQITAGTNAGGMGLTGQSQQITAAQNAGSLANTAQGNQITALGNAMTAGAPRQQGYVLIDPTTGQPVGGSGGATSAAFAGGQVGAAETAGSNTFAMNQANTAAKGIEGTIQQYLASNPQLNSSPVTIANNVQQWIQGKQLGDPAYQTLFNYLNEYISTLAPILGVGGDTTNLKTEIAQSFINAKASGQSISQVLQSIGKLADDKLANLISSGQGGGQVAGGTPQGSTPTSYKDEWPI